MQLNNIQLHSLHYLMILLKSDTLVSLLNKYLPDIKNYNYWKAEEKLHMDKYKEITNT
jgi:uncharacterized Fe-S radical SAM superfamily protein PflX